MPWNAAQAFSNGGTMVVRLGRELPDTADRTPAADADANSDHSRAIAPVTKAAAALVPPNVSGAPPAPMLRMASPGAPMPRKPIERPRFDRLSGIPRRL